MAQRTTPQRRRALIVDDEIIFAINLEADMRELGFDLCDLASNGQQASALAMSNQPDVVLMDINLEGGAKGLRSLGGFIRYARLLSSSLPDTRIATPSIASTNRCREHQCCPNRFIATALPTPWQQVNPPRH